MTSKLIVYDNVDLISINTVMKTEISKWFYGWYLVKFSIFCYSCDNQKQAVCIVGEHGNTHYIS